MPPRFQALAAEGPPPTRWHQIQQWPEIRFYLREQKQCIV